MFRVSLSSELKCILWTLLGPVFLGGTIVAAALEQNLVLLLVSSAGFCAFPCCLVRGERSWLAPLAILIGLSLVLFGAFPETPRLRLAALAASFGLSLAISKACFEDIIQSLHEWQQRLTSVEERRLVSDRALREAQSRWRASEEATTQETRALRERLSREERLSLAYSEELQNLRKQVVEAGRARALRRELNRLRPALYQTKLDLRAQPVAESRLLEKLRQAEKAREELCRRARELTVAVAILQGERETLVQLVRDGERAIGQYETEGYEALVASQAGAAPQELENLYSHVHILEQAVADLLHELKGRCVPLPGLS